MVSHPLKQFLISPSARVSCRHRENRRNDRVSRRKYRSTHLPPPFPCNVRSRGPVKVNNLHTPRASPSPSFHHSILERRKERNNSRRISPGNFLFRKFTHPFPPFKTHTKVLLIILLVPSISLTVIILQRQFLLQTVLPFEQNLLPSRPSSILSFRSPRSESSSSRCGATRMEHGRRGTGATAPPRCEKLCD